MLTESAQNWVYCGWFQDELAEPSDEDREWLAVIIITASSAEKAREWGDHLAKRRTSRNDGNIFLWSDVHLPDDPRYARCVDHWTDVPVICYGEEIDDARIGW